MNEGIVAALFTGMATLVGGVVLALRGLRSDKFKEKVEERTNAFSELEQVIDQLRTDMANMRVAHQQELDRINAHHRRELENNAYLWDQREKQWAQEREEMREELETLKAQVYALMNRPKSARSRRDDR